MSSLGYFRPKNGLFDLGQINPTTWSDQSDHIIYTGNVLDYTKTRVNIVTDLFIREVIRYF